MKKYFLIVMMLMSFISNAQKIEVGIAGGISNNESIVKSYGIYQKDTKNYNSFIDYYAGIRVKVPITKLINIKTGLYFNKKGYNYHEKFYDGQSPYETLMPYEGSTKYVLNYIDIPAILSIKVLKWLDINAGSGFNINHKLNVNNSKFDVPLLFGFSLKRKNLTLDFTKSFGQVPYHTKYRSNLNNIFYYYDFYHNQTILTLGICIYNK